SFALTEDGKEEESPIGKERNSNISTKIAEFASSGTIYTSYKTEDSFIKMKCLDSYKSKFKEYKEKLGRPLLSLICSIQEKMEAFILNDSIDGMEEGKINRKMLPQIAFGLRKDVFTVDAEGIDLNTAVSICVDQSYSMNRIDTQVKNTLIVLGETLNKIEIPFEIFSSSTKSPKNKNDAFTRWRSMVFCIYKDFDDNWNSVCHSVMGFKGLENHIDGESISYSVSNLRKRKEKRKIIFIITDGESFSGQDQNSNAEITKNLSTVIMNARKEGIEVYAIAIDCGDTLSNHYGKENVSIIDSKNSLNFSKTILTDICKIITK
ncbi:MAG: VWA domain-containing protein, partial [Candidatus Omnitrophica bacterium]|nr:VWA domain-containing protein [Candidatus Omnitrophota bacterium]